VEVAGWSNIISCVLYVGLFSDLIITILVLASVHGDMSFSGSEWQMNGCRPKMHRCIQNHFGPMCPSSNCLVHSRSKNCLWIGISPVCLVAKFPFNGCSFLFSCTWPDVHENVVVCPLYYWWGFWYGKFCERGEVVCTEWSTRMANTSRWEGKRLPRFFSITHIQPNIDGDWICRQENLFTNSSTTPLLEPIT
jgi:hypothetical protein